MARVAITWNPFDQGDPGPCINVTVTNSRDAMESGRDLGLEYPQPIPMKALLDTGASVTVISKKLANYCKLFQTNEGSEITAIGATHRCGEHAGAIAFPAPACEQWTPCESFRPIFRRNETTQSRLAETFCATG
jgi:hypothetical protein